MVKSIYIYIILIAVLLHSCKPQVPDQYIQPDDLEDILYDYHIADAMAENGDDENENRYNKVLYRQAVLKKHGVSQADFDSTLVYYTRHADRLHSIYENLSKRLSDEALALGTSVNDINRYGNSVAEGDTANVWTGAESIILTADAPYNVMTFSMTTDTTYHKGDRIILSFNTDFVFKDGIRDAIAMLAVQFTNDSIANNVIHLSSNSKYTVSVSDNDRLGIKSIRGFLYLPKSMDSDRTGLRLLSITNINMVRFHTKEEPKPVPTETKAQPEPDTVTAKKPVAEPQPMPEKTEPVVRKNNIQPLRPNAQPPEIKKPVRLEPLRKISK